MRENGPLEIDGFPSFSYRFFSSLGADANASALFFCQTVIDNGRHHKIIQHT